MRIRAAAAEDNPKLIAIEQLTPQGGQIQLASERKDYFFSSEEIQRSHFFWLPKTRSKGGTSWA